MKRDFPTQRILIVVDAADGCDEETLRCLLERVPAALRCPRVEALVIGAEAPLPAIEGLCLTGLRAKEGCLQKLAYCYALEAGFDLVVWLRAEGDAPEKLTQWLEPFFGEKEPAALAEFFFRLPRSVRAVSTDALRRVPFDRNANDFRFDAELLLQLRLAGLPVRQLPATGTLSLKTAGGLLRTVWRAKAHALNLVYERKFDVSPVELTYDLKLGFASSHTRALDAVAEGACVLDIGCGQGLVAEQMARKARRVVGLDQYARESSPLPNVEFKKWNLDAGEFPLDVTQFDQIFLLDVIEHLKAPEEFMENLRSAAALKRPEIVLTTGNIAFAVTRLGLLLGRFDYGSKGILDRTHTRLFTFGTLRELFEQTGYEILELRGIPAPFPKALGDNALGRGLVRLNQALIRICRGLFSYQIFIRARALPTTPHLLAEGPFTSGYEPPLKAPR